MNIRMIIAIMYDIQSVFESMLGNKRQTCHAILTIMHIFNEQYNFNALKMMME